MLLQEWQLRIRDRFCKQTLQATKCALVEVANAAPHFLQSRNDRRLRASKQPW